MIESRNSTVSKMTPEEYDKWISRTLKSNKSDVLNSRVVWRYDAETYKLIGEYELQEDPYSPGSFLEPENITDVPPPPYQSLKEIFFDPNNKKWFYRDIIHNQVWYNKQTSQVGENVNDANLYLFTNKQPKIVGLMKFNDETENWVWNWEQVKERYLQVLKGHKLDLLKSPLRTSEGVFNGVSDMIPILRDKLNDINLGVVDSVLLRNHDNEMNSYDKEQISTILKEAIVHQENILQGYWREKDEITSLTEDQCPEFFQLDGVVRSSPIGSSDDLYDRNALVRKIFHGVENNFI